MKLDWSSQASFCPSHTFPIILIVTNQIVIELGFLSNEIFKSVINFLKFI